MPRLPRTKDDILDEAMHSQGETQFNILFLEVLCDIRDNLDVPHLTELDITE